MLMLVKLLKYYLVKSAMTMKLPFVSYSEFYCGMLKNKDKLFIKLMLYFLWLVMLLSMFRE